LITGAATFAGGANSAEWGTGTLWPELGFVPATGDDPFSVAARATCALRFAVDNFASCSFKCARVADARFAADAVAVALFRLFDTATFRLATLAGLFAAPDSWVAVLIVELARFRFESFVATVFTLDWIALPVLRAACEFEAGLPLLTRLRALDEVAAFVVCFDLGFAREAAPVFFVFELVVFFDLLRATIANLSTRKLFRIR
jgi:hypothetical protein